MTNLPLLSIIIPTYNYARFLPRAIASVQRQKFSHWELLIIDDGSTDDTPHAVEPLINSDHRLLYIRQDNAGVSVARNHGARLARANFLLCLDADDELLPDAFEHITDSISAHPQALLHLGHHQTVDEHGNVNLSKPQPVFSTPRENFKRFIERQFGIVHGAFVVHRSLFEKFQYPPGITNGEDLVFFAHCLAQTELIGIPRPLASIHVHNARARDNLPRIEAMGLKTVDLLFDPQKLPSDFMSDRTLFATRRLLSLARTYFRHQKYADAFRCYRQAALIRPSVLTDPTHLGRFLRSACWQFFPGR